MQEDKCCYCKTICCGYYGPHDKPLCERHKELDGYCHCGEKKRNCDCEVEVDDGEDCGDPE